MRFNSNQNVVPVLSSAHDIPRALNKFYSHFDENELLQELGGADDRMNASLTVQPAPRVVIQEANKAPVVRL